MVAICDIKTYVHNRTLNFRALDRLVNSPEFDEALRLDSNNAEVCHAIVEGNIRFIERWIDSTLTRELGELSIRKLRLRASELKIPYYTSLTRTELIQIILKATNDKRVKETIG